MRSEKKHTAVQRGKVCFTTAFAAKMQFHGMGERG